LLDTETATDLGVGEDRPCRDEECDGIAEVEVDGNHQFHVCGTCGFEFNHQMVDSNKRAEDACAIGVSEPLRRAASAAPEGALAALAREEAVQSGTVTIGTTIPFGRPAS
jgi:hypothetical protein